MVITRVEWVINYYWWEIKHLHPPNPKKICLSKWGASSQGEGAADGGRLRDMSEHVWMKLFPKMERVTHCFYFMSWLCFFQLPHTFYKSSYFVFFWYIISKFSARRSCVSLCVARTWFKEQLWWAFLKGKVCDWNEAMDYGAVRTVVWDCLFLQFYGKKSLMTAGI